MSLKCVWNFIIYTFLTRIIVLSKTACHSPASLPPSLPPTPTSFILHPSTFTCQYTPISIKVASAKNDAWSMFHSLWCIIVVSKVNYVPAASYRNLESICYVSRMVRQCISKHWILGFLIWDSDLRLGFSLW